MLVRRSGDAHKRGVRYCDARSEGLYLLRSKVPIVVLSREGLYVAFELRGIVDYTPDEVMRDAKGVQVMEVLGRNMAWLLKSIDAGRAAGIEPPAQPEQRFSTNFIR